MKYVLKALKDEVKVTGIANLHFFEFPENYYTNKDSHPFRELVYVSSGKLAINSQNFNGVLDKGCLLIHKPDEIHSLKTVGENTPTVIIIGFDCKGENIDKFASIPIRLDDSEVKTLAEIVKEGRNVFMPPYNVPKYDMRKKEKTIYGAEQMLKNLLEYFLISLTRKIGDLESQEDLLETDKFNVNEIVSYIEENYKEKITLDELAFLFRTNRSTLCKSFKDFTGKTITEYVNDKKLLKAKSRIEKTEKTLTEIAEELNFESIHYFTRFFKKMTGISPKEYRKSIK